MSTFDYDSIRADTLALLEEFGNSLTLDRVNEGGAYDPSTGNVEGGTTTVLNGTGVLLNFSIKEIAASSGSTSIRATDRKLLWQGDELKVNDAFEKFRVHSVGELDPDQSGVILVTAQMRK